MDYEEAEKRWVEHMGYPDREERWFTNNPLTKWKVVADAAEVAPALAGGQRVVALMPERVRKPAVKIRTAADVYEVMFEARLLDREGFYVLCLGKHNKLLGVYVAALGAPGHVALSMDIIFRAPLIMDSRRVVAVHNHPSGTVHPSPDDIAMTERIVLVGELLGCPLKDHVIIGGEGYFSFRESGMLEE